MIGLLTMTVPSCINKQEHEALVRTGVVFQPQTFPGISAEQKGLLSTVSNQNWQEYECKLIKIINNSI